MFLISDITTFSKKKGKRNNLLLGAAILGTGLLGVVGVKSYLRNGRLVKQYNRNQVVKKATEPVVDSTNKSSLVNNLIQKNYPTASPELVKNMQNNPWYLVGGELGKKAKQYNINIDEAIGVHTYMGGGYKEINNYLRDKVKNPNLYNDELEQLSNSAISGMNKLQSIDVNKIPKLDRYIKLNPETIDNYQVGKDYITPQITSTTGLPINKQDINEAALVASDANVKMVYRPKVNSNAKNLGDVHLIEKNEYVYLPGTKFKVSSKKKEIVSIGGKPRVINVIYMDEL